MGTLASRLTGHRSSSHQDAERGGESRLINNRDAEGSGDNRSNNIQIGAAFNPLTPEQVNNLARFRQLVGIFSNADLLSEEHKRPTRRVTGKLRHTRRHVPNNGVYVMVMVEERKASRLYYIISTIINASLGLQLLIAAIITVVSALSNVSIPVTILGAVNTLIAGILAYVKGQGMPIRLVQYRAELRRVRDFIELRERQFEMGVKVDGKELDPEKEAETAMNRFHDAKQDAVNNYPDNYVSTAAMQRVVAPLGATALRDLVAQHVNEGMTSENPHHFRVSGHIDERLAGDVRADAQIDMRGSEPAGPAEGGRQQEEAPHDGHASGIERRQHQHDADEEDDHGLEALPVFRPPQQTLSGMTTERVSLEHHKDETAP